MLAGEFSEPSKHSKARPSCPSPRSGNSINAIVRITGVAKHTVLKLIEDMGCACAEYHHRNVRNLKVRRLQCDEIWAFVGDKAKNVSRKEA